MKSEFYLEDLKDHLINTNVKLDLNFLRRLLEDASDVKQPWKDKKFIEKIGYTFNKEVKCSTGLKSMYSKGKFISFSKIEILINISKYTWRDIEKNMLFIRAGRHGGEIKLRSPIKIDKKLGSVIGHILGDGSIIKRDLQPFYSNSNVFLIKEFIDNMKSIFNMEPRIWLQKSGNFKEKSKWIKRLKFVDEIKPNQQIGLFYPKICGVILHALLGEFAKGKCKKITTRIKNSNIDFKIGLVRAFFDDEGTVYNNRNMLRVFQDDKKLLDDIRDILLKFGIKTNNVWYYVKRNKKRYVFDITNKENFIKFHETIGFTSTSKQLNPV